MKGFNWAIEILYCPCFKAGQRESIEEEKSWKESGYTETDELLKPAAGRVVDA